LGTGSRAGQGRVPSFGVFGVGDCYYNDFANASRPGGSREVQRDPSTIWNHGTLDPATSGTWLAAIGPGVGGSADPRWIDHTDVVPTILYLLGVEAPAYLEGRPLWELLDPSVLPAALGGAGPRLQMPRTDGEGGGVWWQLSDDLKQLAAPMGRLPQASLRLATRGAPVASSPAGREIEAYIAAKAVERDALVG